jgi:autotransporter-associated beta strand protein
LQIGRSDATGSGFTNNSYIQTSGTASFGTLGLGGALNASDTIIATLTLTGGTFTTNSFTLLSAAQSNTSTINIGGTAVVTLPAFPTTRGAGSTATLNFDGGTLQPLAASTSYIGGLTNAFVKAGGANFNVPTGNDITVIQPLLAHPTSTGGGLSKAGLGVLTLSGASTYTGTTAVNSGTLTLGNSGSIANSATILVAAGATFNVASVTGGFALGNSAPQTLLGTGFIMGSVTVSGTSGGTVSAGNPAVNSGTGILTVSGPVTFTTGSTLGTRIINTNGNAFTGTNFGTSGVVGVDSNFLYVGGLLTVPSSGLNVTVDGTGANFVSGTQYSYKIAQGNTISGLSTGTPFTNANFASNGFSATNYSLNTDTSGSVYLNFTATVPEPGTVLGFAVVGLGFGGWIRRRVKRLQA